MAAYALKNSDRVASLCWWLLCYSTLHIPFVKIKSTCDGAGPSGQQADAAGVAWPGSTGRAELGSLLYDATRTPTPAVRGHEPQTTMINVWPFFFTVLWNRWDLLPIKSKSKLQTPPISSKYIYAQYGCILKSIVIGSNRAF